MRNLILKIFVAQGNFRNELFHLVEAQRKSAMAELHLFLCQVTVQPNFRN